MQGIGRSEKFCGGCNTRKPTTDFTPHKRDGLQSRCRPCRLKYPRKRPSPPHNEISLSAADIARFWGKVDKSPRQGPEGECWEWLGGRIKDYGSFSIRRRTYLAHRIAFWIDRGFDPGEAQALHRCDNPSCCRPSHLFSGSPADNVHDSMRKGRRPIALNNRAINADRIRVYSDGHEPTRSTNYQGRT
jgi:hypothetical protein